MPGQAGSRKGKASLFSRQVGIGDQPGRRQEDQQVGIVELAFDAAGEHVGDGLAMAHDAAALHILVVQ